ncbi:TM2 domain-containing protein [Hymenobacter arizonensis]|uniref:TM2 domain-containing membrane protein YozV n=1 Tax=Hymenobacter arizonensis TaxID=1227077 RepID=A0A1I6AK73_HYMAR|nr:TM2 domain-containing protein [Hymenobacter arizonensis]SFQ69073.1 TM2 domain-containing membrane protein YozV [Hymenobacter arizonensis]
MANFYRTLCAFLFLDLINSCQRASYQFQAGAAVAQATVEGPKATAITAGPMSVTEKMVASSRTKTLLLHSRRRPATKARRAAAAVLIPMPMLFVTQHVVIGKRLAKAASPLEPDPPVRYARKGVAFALAVVLGFFGAHLFYLGDNRRALWYLLITLAGLALAALAIPIGNLAVFGGGLGAALVAVFFLLLGVGAVLSVYLRALIDGMHILREGV